MLNNTKSRQNYKKKMTYANLFAFCSILFAQVSIFTHNMIKCARACAKKAVILYREIKDTFSAY